MKTCFSKWCPLLLLALFAGCGNQQEDIPPPSPPPVTQAPVPAPASNPPDAGEDAQQPEMTSESGEMPANPATTLPGGAAVSASDGQDGARVLAPSTVIESDSPLVAEVQEALAELKRFKADANLGRIAEAMHQFAEKNGHFPTINGDGSTSSATGLSWRVSILPMLGEQALYNQFRHDERWDSPHNKSLLSKMPAIFGSDPEGKTSLHLVTGPSGPFQPGIGPRPSDLNPNNAPMILAVQAGPNQADYWTRPGGLTLDPENPAAMLGDVGEKVTAIMYDSSVLSLPVDLGSLAALFQRPGTDTVDAESLAEYKFQLDPKSEWKDVPELPPMGEVAEKIDLRFIPEDATGVVLISPRRILESPLVQNILTELAAPGETTAQTLQRLLQTEEDVTRMIGMVEEIRIIASGEFDPASQRPSPESPTLPPGVDGIVVRLAVPVPVKGVIFPQAESGGEATLQVVRDVPYVHFSEHPNVLVFPEEKVFILARADRAEAIVEARSVVAAVADNNGSTPQERPSEDEPSSDSGAGASAAQTTSKLHSSLNTIGNPMVAVIAHAPEGGFEFIDPMLAAAGPVGALVPQIRETDSLRLTLDLQAEELLHVALGFPSDEPVRAMGEFARQLLRQAQDQGKAVQNLLNQEDPAQKAQYDLIGDLISGSVIKAENKTLALTLKRPEHIDQLLTAFPPSTMAMVLGGAAAPELSPLESVALAMVSYQTRHGHLPAANGSGMDEEKIEAYLKTIAGDVSGLVGPGAEGTSPFAVPPQMGQNPGAISPEVQSQLPPALQKQLQSQLQNQNPQTTPQPMPEAPAEQVPPQNPRALGRFNRMNPAQREAMMRRLASPEAKQAAAIAKNRGLSWRVYLLPELGEHELFAQFNLEERWDSPTNKPLIKMMPKVFGDDPEGKTRLHLVVGNETLFRSGKAPDLSEVRGDPSEMLVLIETGADKADFWTKPGGLPFDPKAPTRCLGKPDPDQTVFKAIMLDWNVREIPVNISDAEFKKMVQVFGPRLR
jgi:Protein of unknown function (DUF1559).